MCLFCSDYGTKLHWNCIILWSILRSSLATTSFSSTATSSPCLKTSIYQFHLATTFIKCLSLPSPIPKTTWEAKLAYITKVHTTIWYTCDNNHIIDDDGFRVVGIRMPCMYVCVPWYHKTDMDITFVRGGNRTCSQQLFHLTVGLYSVAAAGSPLLWNATFHYQFLEWEAVVNYF